MAEKNTGLANAANMQMALNEVPLPVFIIDLQGNFIWVSADFAALFDRNAESLSGTPFEDILPVKPFHFLKSEQDMAASSATVEISFSMKLNAKERSFRSILQSWKNAEDSLLGFVGILLDTTLEEELREQLGNQIAQAHIAQRLVHFGIFELSLPEGVMLWSPIVDQMTGRPASEREMGLDEYLQLAHPEDRDTVDAVFMKALREKRAFVLDHRICMPDGSIKYVRVSADLVKNKSGGKFTGTIQDITGWKQTENKLHNNQERAEALARLSQSLSEAGLDYKMILSNVAQGIGGLFGDACAIRLLSDEDNWLELSAFYSPLLTEKSPVDVWLFASRQPANQGYWKEVIAEGAPILIAQLEPQIGRQFGLIEALQETEPSAQPSLMIVPMRTMQGVIGAITLVRAAGHEPYHSEDLVLLQDLAQRSAFAIESARLYESEARRLHELDSLYSATRALLTTLDYETLLGRILDAAISAIPAAEKGILNLMAPETGKLEIQAMFGYKDPRIRTSTRRRIHGYTALAIQQRKPMLIHDATMEGLYGLLEGEAEDLPVRSIIIAPLILDDQALGALILSASSRSAFTQDDLRLLESFAATISAAINNSLLHSRMQRLAITDSVTNLYNRRGFYELARREIERARRFGHSLSVIMMDLDQLKSVNDTYGHAVGDQVLRTLADRLSQHVREFDILCRYGGDEFALLLPETDLFMAASVAERLRVSIADEPIKTEGGPVLVTISLGVTKATPNTTNLEELLKSADRALYAAKQGGRNRLEIT
jgi:diguanylate cyclase (GGDEF)-like protein/PAS domain S-box-containing protein